MIQSSPATPSSTTRIRTIIRAVTAAVLLVLIVGGVPPGLTAIFGNPLPGWQHLVARDLSGTAVLAVLATFGWALWARFTFYVIMEIHAVITRPRVPRPHQDPRPGRQHLARTLVSTVLALSPLIPAAGPSPAVSISALPVAGATLDTAAATALHREPAVFAVGEQHYRYVVHPGDTLSQIARDWLGDADRWPQICRLNRHHHWNHPPGTLHDCDLIRPGWTLRLPDDATPPRTTTPPPTSTGEPGRRPRHKKEPAPPAGSLPTGSPSSPVREPAPTPSSQPTGTPGTDVGVPASRADQQGVHLPGSYLPWTLAAGIAAALALLWMQRRRRHVPGSLDDDPTDLPESVLEIDRQVAQNPDLPTHPYLAERAVLVPSTEPGPAGGVGLIGDGAPAAARAALATALVSGGSLLVDEQSEVVIDVPTVKALGIDTVTQGAWPRLHVVDTLESALNEIEAQILQRARVLNDHDANDLEDLRIQDPDEDPLPPLLLITQSPPPAARIRTRTTLDLGAGLEISAVLLGEWTCGSTLSVDLDGFTHLIGGPPPDGIGDRLAVLAPNDARAILATVREAHTGKRPAHTSTSTTTTIARTENPGTVQVDLPVAETAGEPVSTLPEKPDSASEPAESADSADRPPAGEMKARLSVFGSPHVEDLTAPGQPLRAKAAELAVFLACHPEGADTRTIGEHLERDVRLRYADIRVHTNVSNLRHVLGRAAGARKIGYVIKVSGRYRLDPTTVHVDLWEQRDLLTRAATAPPEERITMLRRACELYTAPLADTHEYDWIEPYREKARQQATDAHLLLAENLLPDDPQAASDVLDRAIGFDQYNEHLYRRAMRARHRLGDVEGISGLLRAVTFAVSELGADPEEETVELARSLRQPDAPPR